MLEDYFLSHRSNDICSSLVLNCREVALCSRRDEILEEDHITLKDTPVFRASSLLPTHLFEEIIG